MTPHKVYDPGGSNDYADDSADDDAIDELDCILICMDALMSATDVFIRGRQHSERESS